ncbi:MAG: carbohydrate binding domain-containing protein [Melioribacteraceae bacterium]|nr:carbohydrate binding domain-containing protein [Melioribacteraceae bacterium]
MKKCFTTLFYIQLFFAIFIKAQQTNLILNPSFEEGNGTPAGWVINSGYGAVFNWSNQVARSGQYSVSISELSLPWSQLSWESQNLISVDPGTTYDAECWVFFSSQPSIGETAELGITEYDQNGNFIKGAGIAANAVAGNWVECKKNFTTSSNTTHIKISLSHIYRNNDDVAIVFFDDVSVIKNIPNSKVVLLSPVINQGQVNPLTTFSWSNYDGASNYTLEINNSLNFNNPLYSYSTNQTTLILPQQLNEYSVYYWRVKADNSQWSDIWNFFTGPSQIPKLLEPKNNYDEVPAQNAFLQWTWINGATNYRVEVSENQNFSSIFYQKEENTTFIGNLSFTEANTYYWRVSAFVNGAWSSWSEIFQFTVKTIQVNIPDYKYFAFDAMIPGDMNLNFRGSLAGDIRGDGIKRIVLGGGKSGQLLFYKYQNNLLIPDGAKQILDSPMNFTNIIPKAIGDVDGDGLNEIIVLTSGLSQQWQPNLLQIFKWDGNNYSELVRLQSGDYNVFDQSTIIIENIDQNGVNEIIMPVNGRLGIYRYSGNTLQKVAELNLNAEQKFVIGNCDADPDLEIIICEVSQSSSPVNLRIFGFSGANFINKYSIPGFEYPMAGLAVQDLNGDGINEIFCSTGQYSSYNYSANIFSYNGSGFDLIKNFRITSGITKAKIGDIDGDGNIEVVMFRNSSGSYVIDYENSNYTIGYLNHIGVVDDGDVIDIDSDGYDEILASSYGGFQVVSILNEMPKLNLISPADGANIIELSPTFSWSAFPGAANYVFYLRKGDNFSPPSIYVQVLSETSLTLPVTLEPNSTYSWRVRALDQNLTFSDINTFSTSLPTKPIFTSYICDMSYEILSGRFNPQTDYVELRGTEFGWGAGVRMTQNPNEPNLYIYNAIHYVEESGINLPDYKFWYSTLQYGDIWEGGNNRTHNVTQDEFNNNSITITRPFDDLTTANSTNRATTILIQINLNGGKDVGGNPLPSQINTVHLTGSSAPLSWKGWSSQSSQFMITMYDDGTHGDLFPNDKVYSNLISFPIYTKFQVELAYVINYDITQPQYIVYENNGGDNHIFMLEHDLVKAKVKNVYGFMSNYGEIITPLYDKEFINTVEQNLANRAYVELINNTSGKLRKDIQKSYDFFLKSLDSKLWEDESHLKANGQQMFESSKNAVKDLMKLDDEQIYDSKLLPIIIHIFNSDKYVVELYYSELMTKYEALGCGLTPTINSNCSRWKRDLDDAQKLLNDAYRDYLLGNYDKAIITLKQAWMNLNKVEKIGLAKEVGENIITEDIPTEFSLSQNYPNPFNPSTQIQFGLPSDSKVQVNIFNVLGQKVQSLTEQFYQAGTHTLNFNADELSNGVYIYSINAISDEGKIFRDTKKMLLVK